MWLKNIFLYLLLLSVILVNAQAPSKFYCTYGGSGYDVGYDVKQTLDGGYIITGSTSSFGKGNTDMYLLKLDSMGQKKFETSFGGYNNDIGKSIVQLADSSYVILGYTSSIGIGGYDVYLVKADKTGALLWEKSYGGNDWDFAYSLQQTNDGGFIIAGTTYSFGHGNADGYIIKTNANGDTTWTRTYGGLKDDEFKSVIQTTDGNYALAGYTKSYHDSLGDVWALKINQTGDTLWRKFYGGNKQDFGNQIIEHPNGDFFIAGGTESFGVGLLDGYSLRLDNIGNQLLHQEHGSSGYNEEFSSIVVAKRNSNFIGLMEKEFFIGFKLQFRLIEWSINLNYSNATDYGSVDDDETFKIIATKDKGFACVGYTYGYGALLSDVYFLKSDSNLYGSTSIVSVSEIINDVISKVYPNPTSNVINIVFNDDFKNVLVKLYDVIGNEIYLNKKIEFVSNKHILIDTQELNNGVYFLKINDATEKISIFHN